VCGSGILDLCAELFRAGLIDRAGRFVPRARATFKETDRGKAFVLAGGDASASGSDISFTASDLKSVIRTKAALCAAADALLQAVGISREKVARVYIAGGFGNFLDLRSALTIGVFPPFPLSKFVPLGNASLAGGGINSHLMSGSFAIKHIIREYQSNPGIYEGDQFFFNDPYIASMHNADMFVAAPIFYQGERIAWTVCVTHTVECGGINPGGMSPAATV